MIPLLTRLIREHPEWLQSPAAPLSFMKFSTPASGTGTGTDKGKVLLFVFEEGSEEPSLCVKTTRTYPVGDVIRRNHANLQLLEEGVRGSEHSRLFARPLHLHDDGESIFCIESVCPGEMFSSQARAVELVVEEYSAWQRHLARTAESVWRAKDVQDLVRGTIDMLGLSKTSALALWDHYQKFPLNKDTQLPMLVQHGDMTPDNVLISSDGIHLIDYDYVGVNMLPGFDLFNFLLKSKRHAGPFRSYGERYFPSYFRSIGARAESYEGILFAFYLQELFRKKNAIGEKGGDEILAGFEALMNGT